MLGRGLLGIEDLDRDDIEKILDTAMKMKEIGERDVKKVPTLRGRTIINLFFESSTRTRTSFEIAGKRLSADVVNFSPSSSSLTKSESILDTAKTLDAMDPDAVVIRHKVAGVPKRIADELNAPVINAGDGAHEHPTQALLDMMTVLEKRGASTGSPSRSSATSRTRGSRARTSTASARWARRFASRGRRRCCRASRDARREGVHVAARSARRR